MRKDQKPYRNRKPFKRKSGGPKFMLGGGGTNNSKFSFDAPLSDNSIKEGMANLLSLIFGKKRKEQGVMLFNK